jgi:hypothetical protein
MHEHGKGQHQFHCTVIDRVMAQTFARGGQMGGTTRAQPKQVREHAATDAEKRTSNSSRVGAFAMMT